MNWKTLICSLLLALPALADDFQAANALYDAGKFPAAAQQYEALTPKTSAVFYNLGNAYYRQERLGLALLNFERARRLAPRDPDILANLRFTAARLGVTVLNEPASPVRAYIESVTVSRTLGEWSLFEVVGIWLTVLTFAGWLWWPRYRFVLGVALVVAVLWLTVSAGALVWKLTRLPAAVAVTSGEARFAPLAAATVHYAVGEGTKLGVVEDRGQWWFVERADGRRGWVAANTVQLVNVD